MDNFLDLNGLSKIIDNHKKKLKKTQKQESILFIDNLPKINSVEYKKNENKVLNLPKDNQKEIPILENRYIKKNTLWI